MNISYKRIFVIALAGFLSSNALFAADTKTDAKNDKKEVSPRAEAFANRKLVVELEKLIEARGTVENIFIQVNKPKEGSKDKASATVLVEEKSEGSLTNDEISKIKTLISASIVDLDAGNITITKIHFDELKRKFAPKDGKRFGDRFKSRSKSRKGSGDKKSKDDKKSKEARDSKKTADETKANSKIDSDSENSDGIEDSEGFYDAEEDEED